MISPSIGDRQAELTLSPTFMDLLPQQIEVCRCLLFGTTVAKDLGAWVGLAGAVVVRGQFHAQKQRVRTTNAKRQQQSTDNRLQHTGNIVVAVGSVVSRSPEVEFPLARRPLRLLSLHPEQSRVAVGEKDRECP